MSTVLFAGFGDLGAAAGRLLAAAGHRVVALRRRSPAEPPAGVETHAIDLSGPFALPVAPDALVICVTPARRDPAAYEATYVGVVEQLLRALAAARASPRLALFVSSTSVWSAEIAGWVDEDTPTCPEGFSGEVMVRAEQTLFGAGLAATALRLAGIYGPGRTMMVRKAQAIAERREPWPAPSFTNRVHRDDAAAMIAFLVEQALLGIRLEPIYNGVDDEPALNHEVLAFLAGLVPRASTEPLASPPRAEPTAELGKRVSGERLRGLGFRCAYPSYREGYPPIVEAFLRG